MNRYNILILIVISLFLISCKKDNYAAPDARIFGAVIDKETGEFIQQDPLGGSAIVFKEYGFENPEELRMIFKVNGEYRNNLMFSGKYDFYFYESNFIIPETLKEYKIKRGDNRLDFNVIPYIRISNVKMTKTEKQVHVKFDVTPTVPDKVREIGLFADPDFWAGNSISIKRTTQPINESFKGETRTYELTMDISTGELQRGKPCYFRVGAIIDYPNSRYNYAPSTRYESL